MRGGTLAPEETGFDLIVVGGGPAGYVGALRGAELGMRVALIETGDVGGVCLHQGCIPTKALLEVSSLIQKTAQAGAMGLHYDPPRVVYGEVKAFGQSVVRRLHQGIRHLLKTGGVVSVQGMGSLRGPGKVAVINGTAPEEILSSPRILLATGSRPKTLPGLDFDHDRIIDSTDALNLDPAGKTIGILGGGVVGVEFSQIFRSLGASVTILEREPGLLPGEDPELVSVLFRELERQEIRILTGVSAGPIAKTGTGVRLTVAPRDPSQGPSEELVFDHLLVAVGRVPSLDGLNPGSVGLTPAPGGFLSVDGFGWTGVEGLYAAGDMVGGAMLAHAASHEAIVAVESMAGLNPSPVNPDLVPRVVYTTPEVVSVGLGLDQALKRGLIAREQKFPLLANGRSLIHGERRGLVKVVVEEHTGALLGFGGVGPGMSEILPVATLAIGMVDGATRISHSIFPHPTVAETLWEAIRSR